MVAFLAFLRDWISSMRSCMGGNPCFFCGAGRTHIQLFKDGLASSPSFYADRAGKTRTNRVVLRCRFIEILLQPAAAAFGQEGLPQVAKLLEALAGVVDAKIVDADA